MSELLAAVEAERIRDRLSQRDVAIALGMTQGHFSKVVRGLVPISARAADRMRVWLANRVGTAGGGAAPVGAANIAGSIKSKCMEIMHLVDELTSRPPP